VQDALCLGEHLTTVLRDGAADGHLDRYQALRQPIARHVVRMTDRMTRLATATSPLARLARRALLRVGGHTPPVRARIAAAMAEIDLPRTSG
jgi:2-polyprenyl-6-methoxyphenol hydroxylase-like FAD-dependent oxidoreductase